MKTPTPLMLKPKEYTAIKKAAIFVLVVMLIAIFSSCEKENPVSEGNPTISKITITDTTPSESGYSIVSGTVKTTNAIGIITEGYVGGYIPTKDDLAAFSFEVLNGVRTPLTITAINNWPNPINCDIDTLWVLVPANISVPPVDTIQPPADTIQTLADIIIGEWETSFQYAKDGDTIDVTPSFSSATFFNNGVAKLETFSGYIYPEYKAMGDSSLVMGITYQIINFSKKEILLLEKGANGNFLINLHH